MIESTSDTMEETPVSRARAEVRRVREKSAAVRSWKRKVFMFSLPWFA